LYNSPTSEKNAAKFLTYLYEICEVKSLKINVKLCYVRDRIFRSLRRQLVNSFARRHHVFDMAAKPTDVYSNFLAYPAPLLLFQFRPRCNHFNLFTVLITSREFH